uniref:Uncharacterized protein n=1 Tax=Cacopsylla melanoneura TaxID=428564 RepID=A0A8D8QNB5_9HEMI
MLTVCLLSFVQDTPVPVLVKSYYNNYVMYATSIIESLYLRAGVSSTPCCTIYNICLQVFASNQTCLPTYPRLTPYWRLYSPSLTVYPSYAKQYCALLYSPNSPKLLNGILITMTYDKLPFNFPSRLYSYKYVKSSSTISIN